jgi:hypothetical protein
MTTLRKTHLAFLIALATLVAVPQAAQAQLGVAAGANFDNLSDIEAENREATFNRATGFHVGLFYDAAFGPLALRPGIFYMDAGDFSSDDVQAGNVNVEQQDFSLSLVQIPIDARFRLATLPLISPYLTAGPVFRIELSDDEAETESDGSSQALGLNSSDFSVAGNVGIGVEVDLPGAGVRLFPEFRYAFGLTGYASEFQVPGTDQTIEADDGGNLSSYMLRLGIGL